MRLSSGSLGHVIAKVFGNSGDDLVGLAVTGGQSQDSWSLELNGGRGFDRCTATDNVMANGCEEIDDLATAEIVSFLFPSTPTCPTCTLKKARYTI